MTSTKSKPKLAGRDLSPVIGKLFPMHFGGERRATYVHMLRSILLKGSKRMR